MRQKGTLTGQNSLTGLPSEASDRWAIVQSPIVPYDRDLTTATAMAKSVLRPIPCAQFLVRLSRDALLEGFVQYLTVRIADQQDIIANLVTVDSEQRLGQTLLDLARKLGKEDPRSIRIEQRITHEELAAMVGTTRPRVSEFMGRFRELGLIEISAERQLIVKEAKLTAYLERIN